MLTAAEIADPKGHFGPSSRTVLVAQDVFASWEFDADGTVTAFVDSDYPKSFPARQYGVKMAQAGFRWIDGDDNTYTSGMWVDGTPDAFVAAVAAIARCR